MVGSKARWPHVLRPPDPCGLSHLAPVVRDDAPPICPCLALDLAPVGAIGRWCWISATVGWRVEMVTHPPGPTTVWMAADRCGDRLDWRNLPSRLPSGYGPENRTTEQQIQRQGQQCRLSEDMTSTCSARVSCERGLRAHSAEVYSAHGGNHSLGRRHYCWRAMILLTAAHLPPNGSCTAHRVPKC